MVPQNTHLRDMRECWIVILAGVLAVITVAAGSAIFCSQCDSDTDPNCMDNPPHPQNCTSCERFDTKTAECEAYMPLSYCQIERRYLNSTLIRIRRDCIPAMMRKTCKTVQEHDEEIQVCFETCRTDGCNMNDTARLRSNIPSIVLMLLLTLMCIVRSV